MRQGELRGKNRTSVSLMGGTVDDPPDGGLRQREAEADQGNGVALGDGLGNGADDRGENLLGGGLGDVGFLGGDFNQLGFVHGVVPFSFMDEIECQPLHGLDLLLPRQPLDGDFRPQGI